MIVRAYNPAKDDIGHLKPEGIDLDRDFVEVVENDGRIVGLLAWRMVGFVHQMLVEDDNPLNRHIVERAIDYAMGSGRAIGLRQCLFMTIKGNDSFREFMKNQGAAEQNPEKMIYLMEVR